MKEYTTQLDARSPSYRNQISGIAPLARWKLLEGERLVAAGWATSRPRALKASLWAAAQRTYDAPRP